MGAFFISSIGDNVIWAHFPESRYEIRNNPDHPFYDPHFESIFLMDNVFDKFIYIYNNPAYYHLGLEGIVDEITREVYKEEEWTDYMGLTFEEALAISNAFGKFADANGVVKIREDWVKLWENWRSSGTMPTAHNRILWHPVQLSILRSRIELIHDFYQQFAPDYTPAWVTSSTLYTSLWNSFSEGHLD